MSRQAVPVASVGLVDEVAYHLRDLEQVAGVTVTKPINLDQFDHVLAEIRNFFGHTVTLPGRASDTGRLDTDQATDQATNQDARPDSGHSTA